MERRDFLKATVLTGATAALSGCEKPMHTLVRFLPEEDILPGVAAWKPSLCTLCPAGCGLTVRVMQGEAEVVRNGERGLIQMGLAKKLEGNPLHPINQGKLCARGQAGLQLTYHPDRVKTPLKRSGPRGTCQFEATTWDEAISALVSKLRDLREQDQTDTLRFLASGLRGHRFELVRRFLWAFGASPTWVFDPIDEPVLRHANELSFGQAALPSFDLAHSHYVISFGADFLGTWNSPVAQAIGYGEMRQGQPGRRGKLVQVEQRVSQTGADADEWIASPIGMEGAFALSLAHVIQKEGLRPTTDTQATRIIPTWRAGLPDYSPASLENKLGVSAQRIGRLARELAVNSPAVAIIGGAPLAQTNGLFNALAVNALNSLLGSVAVSGGTYFSPRPPLTNVSEPPTHNVAGDQLARELADTAVLLLFNANPVYASPPAWKIRQALEKVPFIVSFGSFLDETSSLADLFLPDHSPLESWLGDIPECGSPRPIMTLTPPVMSPLHDTRAMPDVLLEIAHRLGGDPAEALPEQNFEELLHSSAEALRPHGTGAALASEKNWTKIQEQGGWWGNEAEYRLPSRSVHAGSIPESEPRFDGGSDALPFHFLPYFSQAFLDGSLAHLPWMQELPDALSTAMWGSWVELNPRTASRLGIEQGDLVEVHSPHGKLQAPALISPAIAPDVIAMPFGQGHEQFGQYASKRGANPMTILAPLQVSGTGSLAWGATRVSVARVGKTNLALFSGGLFERPPELEQR